MTTSGRFWLINHMHWYSEGYPNYLILAKGGQYFRFFQLHISLSTLDTYVKKGAITCSHVGKRVLFSQDDIDKALAKNRIN